MKYILSILLFTLQFCFQAHSASLDFGIDGNPKAVKLDTVTPGNSIPLPIRIHDTAGNAINPLASGTIPTFGQKTMSGSLPVAIASDQSSIPVSGPLTDAQLRASAVLVTVGSSALPAGAATEATLSSLNGKFNSLGQKTMANSAPVVISSDQSAIPASQSGTWDINNISGTISLPTGASTEATLSTLNGKVANNFGADSGGIRVNSQVGNSTGAANFNYGTVGAQTLRSAAQVGNATGAADFNSGSIGAQTLRVAAILANGSGEIAYGAGNSSVQTPRVVVATDQAGIQIKAALNTNGSEVETALTGTTASTASVPSNTVGLIIQAPDTNTDNIRYRIGATASTTAGMQLQPGRDSGFIPVSANVSVCAEASGTNAYQIQWILSQ